MSNNATMNIEHDDMETRKPFVLAFITAMKAISDGEENWRLAADKFLEAVETARLCAPDIHQRRWYVFTHLTRMLESPEDLPGFEITKADYEAMKKIHQDADEPMLFRWKALVAMGKMKLFHREVEEGLFHLRKFLDMASSMPSQARDQQVMTALPTYDGENGIKSVGAIIDEETESVRKTLNAFSNISIIGCFVESTIPLVDGKTDGVLARRLTVNGGRECDCCGKTSDDIGRNCLARCTKCKQAYYCSRKCQLKQWRGGHEHACYCPGQIAVGDYMIKKELGADTTKKMQLVHVIGPGDDAGHWKVSTSGISNSFLVEAEELLHLRPAK
jgi:hypothetical protein